MAGKAFLYMGGPNGPATTPARSDSGVDNIESGSGARSRPRVTSTPTGYDDFVVGAPNSGRAAAWAAVA